MSNSGLVTWAAGALRQFGVLPPQGTGLVVRARRFARRFGAESPTTPLAGMTAPRCEPPTSQEYWTKHNVTLHRRFSSTEESLAYLQWRNDIYVGAAELLPTGDQDGKTVLDYGCGPGNDLLGFATQSRPRRLIGMDVSSTSLQQADERLRLHGILGGDERSAELIQIDERQGTLPLEDASVDYIHCSGVLHHVADPAAILREFRRILCPGGECRIMVYNYFSIFMHLHVAYLHRLLDPMYKGMSLEDCFRASTDGFDCPISRAYRPVEWRQVCLDAGFRCTHIGNAAFVYELSILPRRFEAILDQSLPAEHRDFLLALTFDERGVPYYRGQVAGIPGCYSLHPMPMA